VIHEFERDLEDGEWDQKYQDSKETRKGVVPAEQDDIPQLVRIELVIYFPSVCAC
jgi:hypothetical protein